MKNETVERKKIYFMKFVKTVSNSLEQIENEDWTSLSCTTDTDVTDLKTWWNRRKENSVLNKSPSKSRSRSRSRSASQKIDKIIYFPVDIKKVMFLLNSFFQTLRFVLKQ